MWICTWNAYLVPDPIRDVSLGGEDFWNIFILSHASSSPSAVTGIKPPVIFDTAECQWLLSVFHIAIKTLYLLFVCFRFFESIYSLHAFDCCLKPTVTYFISCPIVKPKKNAFSGKFSQIWVGGVADFQTRSYKAIKCWSTILRQPWHPIGLVEYI